MQFLKKTLSPSSPALSPSPISRPMSEKL
jgi:hypothetical protein